MTNLLLRLARPMALVCLAVLLASHGQIGAKNVQDAKAEVANSTVVELKQQLEQVKDKTR